MRAIISGIFICFTALLVTAQTQDNARVSVAVVTDDADAVLNILEKKQARREVTETDWQLLFFKRRLSASEKLLGTYNKAMVRYNRRYNKDLISWPGELLKCVDR